MDQVTQQNAALVEQAAAAAGAMADQAEQLKGRWRCSSWSAGFEARGGFEIPLKGARLARAVQSAPPRLSARIPIRTLAPVSKTSAPHGRRIHAEKESRPCPIPISRAGGPSRAPTPAASSRPTSGCPGRRRSAMGVQHVVAMFGATVLAPILMGFDPNLAILMSRHRHADLLRDRRRPRAELPRLELRVHRRRDRRHRLRAATARTRTSRGARRHHRLRRRVRADRR